MEQVGAHALSGPGSSGSRIRASSPGTGRYVDDVVLPGMLHAAFLRSYVPHGRLNSVDASEARELPGVVAVYTGEDMVRLTEPVTPGAIVGMNLIPGMQSPSFYAAGHRQGPPRRRPDRAGHRREPLHRRGRARADRRGHRPARPDRHLRGRPRPVEGPDLRRGRQQRPPARSELPLGDVDAAFAKADRVVTASIDVHRHQPVPMECRALIADWDGEAEHLTLYASTQSPHMYRMLLPGPDRRAHGPDPGARRPTSAAASA